MTNQIKTYRLFYGMQEICSYTCLKPLIKIIKNDFQQDKLIDLKSYVQYTRLLNKTNQVQILIPDRPSIFIKKILLNKSHQSEKKPIMVG
jgi:hypothetical protein